MSIQYWDFSQFVSLRFCVCCNQIVSLCYRGGDCTATACCINAPVAMSVSIMYFRLNMSVVWGNTNTVTDNNLFKCKVLNSSFLLDYCIQVSNITLTAGLNIDTAVITWSLSEVILHLFSWWHKRCRVKFNILPPQKKLNNEKY